MALLVWFWYGCIGRLGAHILDTAHEFLELGLPYEVTMQYANGHNDYFFPYSSTILFRFPQRKGMPPVDITWYDGLDNLPPIPAGYGVSGLDPNIPATNQGDTPAAKLNPGKIIYTKDLIFKGGVMEALCLLFRKRKRKRWLANYRRFLKVLPITSKTSYWHVTVLKRRAHRSKSTVFWVRCSHWV